MDTGSSRLNKGGEGCPDHPSPSPLIYGEVKENVNGNFNFKRVYGYSGGRGR
jgi:hypothetical protein